MIGRRLAAIAWVASAAFAQSVLLGGSGPAHAEETTVASDISIVSGNLLQLLDAIPVLPRMEVGFKRSLFPNLRAERSMTAGTVDVPTILPKAAWAAGGYGWTQDQRARMGLALPSGTVAVESVVVESPIAAMPLSAPRIAMASQRADRYLRECADDSALTCILDYLPADDRPRVAAQILVGATHWRLAMDPDEERVLRRWLTGLWAIEPDTVVSVRTADTPRLPTTYEAAGSGRLVEPQMFGLLAPPDTGSVPQVPYYSLRLWDSGVSWAELQPTRGPIRWKLLDEAVAFAERQGREVLYVLGPVPQWASAEPDRPNEGWGKGAGGPLTSEGERAYVAYVDALLDRYGERIDAIEAWNEANLPSFWRGTPDEMAEMTKTVYDAVQERELDIDVYAASATTRVAGSIYRFFPAYLEGLEKRGWPVDGFAVHAYPDADGTASDMSGLVAQFKAYLAIANAPDLPIANTELNYGLAGPGDKPHRDVPRKYSEAWVTRTFLDSIRLGLDSTYWFAWTPKYYGQLGIQLNPDTPDTIRAWETFYGWVVGSTYLGCTEPGGAVLCEFTEDGRSFWIGYADRATVVDAPGGAVEICELRGRCGPPLGSKVVLTPRPARIEGAGVQALKNSNAVHTASTDKIAPDTKRIR